jgi:purine-binding chemotaxis protein CheW
MSGRALELGREFDHSFAAALPPPAPPHLDFLCIRIGGEPSAVALGDIASLHADLRIIALPSRAPELLGVASVRAAIVPIYDLGAAVGAQAAAAPRWTVLLNGRAAGFAFEAYDGHTRVTAAAIADAPAPGGGPRQGYVRGRLTVAGQPRPIVDLLTVLTAIESRWRPAGPAKDQ